MAHAMHPKIESEGEGRDHELDTIPKPPKHMMIPPFQVREAIAMKVPYTVALITPPSSQLYAPAICQRLYAAGLMIGEFTRCFMSREFVCEFYKEHADKAYFRSLVVHMCSGPMIVMRLFAADFEDNAVNDPVAIWRGLIGPPLVEDARREDPFCLRALYGIGGVVNAIHGSATWQDAVLEDSLIDQFFKSV